MTPRYLRFVVVGLLGFLLQLTAIGILTTRARWPWLPATLVSVELAVIHNYLWHARWTWRDRAGTATARFLRFQLANGLASIVGNTLLMAVLAGVLGLPAVPANALAVAVMSAATFVTADRWVFRRSGGLRTAVVVSAACLLTPVRAVAQAPEALTAWERHVAGTEARLERSRFDPAPRAVSEIASATGESIRVPSGTLSDWRGSVFIPHVTLERVLYGLQHPGTPPPQEDVSASRVIWRADDALRVSIRLVRRAIVTVSYDTEHEMQFQRWSRRLATARSVATRIEEVGGGDHGLLWRLNSYWRYEEVDGGVVVDLESLTLSRAVPSLIRPIAAPLVARIARESVLRTLEALQRFFNAENTTSVMESPVAVIAR